MDIRMFLQRHNLRDTQPRRSVLAVLDESKTPLSASDMHKQLQEKNIAINLVTVYRVLDAYEKEHIVHKHPDNTFSLCSMPETKGHHGFLRCTSCGVAEEFAEPKLCKIEEQIAKQSSFQSKQHHSEIVGVCADCQ